MRLAGLLALVCSTAAWGAGETPPWDVAPGDGALSSRGLSAESHGNSLALHLPQQLGPAREHASGGPGISLFRASGLHIGTALSREGRSPDEPGQAAAFAHDFAAGAHQDLRSFDVPGGRLKLRAASGLRFEYAPQALSGSATTFSFTANARRARFGVSIRW